MQTSLMYIQAGVWVWVQTIFYIVRKSLYFFLSWSKYNLLILYIFRTDFVRVSWTLIQSEILRNMSIITVNVIHICLECSGGRFASVLAHVCIESMLDKGAYRRRGLCLPLSKWFFMINIHKFPLFTLSKLFCDFPKEKVNCSRFVATVLFCEETFLLKKDDRSSLCPRNHVWLNWLNFIILVKLT